MPKFATLNKRKIFTAVLALAILALVAYGVIVAIDRSSIPQFDGDEFSIVILDKTSGGLYEWSYSIEDTTIAEVTDKTSSIEYLDDEKQDGGTPVEQFIIKGNKPGKTKITFRYGSFADGSVEEEHTYRIEVNEKLQSRVIEQQ